MPALGRHLAVALGVGRGEVLGGGRARGRPGAGGRGSRSARVSPVRPAPAAASRPARRSSGVVTLRFSRGASTSRTVPPMRLDERRVVGGRRQHVRRAGRARARARRGGRPAASGPPTAASGPACATTTGPGAGLLDRVGHRRRGDRGVAVLGGEDVEAVPDDLAASTSGRAASWTTRTSACSPRVAQRRLDRQRAVLAALRRRMRARRAP